MMIIFMSVMAGLIMILQFLIAPLSHFLLEMKYYIYKLFGSKKGFQHKSIVYKNMDSNSTMNRNIGATFIGIIVIGL
jgi:hypothetical protein